MRHQIDHATRGSTPSPASIGLVIIHLNSEEARKQAPHFLPKTGMRLRRPGDRRQPLLPVSGNYSCRCGEFPYSLM